MFNLFSWFLSLNDSLYGAVREQLRASAYNILTVYKM